MARVEDLGDSNWTSRREHFEVAQTGSVRLPEDLQGEGEEEAKKKKKYHGVPVRKTPACRGRAVDGGGEGVVVAEGLDTGPDIVLVGLVDDANDTLGMPASVQVPAVQGRGVVDGIEEKRGRRTGEWSTGWPGDS